MSEMIPLWLCIPFAGLLLCIAVLPLIKPHWWEEHQPHAVAFWSLLFVVPFALMYGVSHASETVLECMINDYLTFIVLLFGLCFLFSMVPAFGFDATQAVVMAQLLAALWAFVVNFKYMNRGTILKDISRGTLAVIPLAVMLGFI